MVGTGMILTYEEAVEVIEAGVVFLSLPTIFERRILDLCRECGAVSVPSVFSPLEIRQNFPDGMNIVKTLPAGRLGSGHTSDIQAPLGKVPPTIVGGIDASNVQEYFAAGALLTGIGSSILLKEDMLNGDEEGIHGSIAIMEEKMKNMEEKES